MALLDAAAIVLQCFTPLYATWVKDTFIARLEAYRLLDPASLDDALSVKREHKQLARQREVERWRGPIIQYIAELEHDDDYGRGRAFEVAAYVLGKMQGKTISKAWIKSIFEDKASRPLRVLYGVDKRPSRKKRRPRLHKLST